MKKIAQIKAGFLEEPIVNGWKHYLDKLIIVDSIEDADPEIPMILPANPIGDTQRWMRAGNPYFALNRPYIGSWSAAKRFAARVSVNSFACTKLGDMPFSRWNTTRLEKQPWKVTEVKNVLIATSNKSQGAFTNVSQQDWAEDIKSQLEGANVKIRYKSGKKSSQHHGDASRGVTGLFGDDGEFEWADLVISYSSAITCEAFWFGKKAISLGVCPTWVACDNHLANWNVPQEPINRDIWHEHMAWVQFNIDEWESGAAQEMTVHYQGWPTEVPHTNNDFK